MAEALRRFQDQPYRSGSHEIRTTSARRTYRNARVVSTLRPREHHPMLTVRSLPARRNFPIPLGCSASPVLQPLLSRHRTHSVLTRTLRRLLRRHELDSAHHRPRRSRTRGRPRTRARPIAAERISPPRHRDLEITGRHTASERVCGARSGARTQDDGNATSVADPRAPQSCHRAARGGVRPQVETGEGPVAFLERVHGSVGAVRGGWLRVHTEYQAFRCGYLAYFLLSELTL